MGNIGVSNAMLNDQDLCKQALAEFCVAVDQVIHNYDNPPLNLEKAKQPRVGRDQFLFFMHQLAFAEQDLQGVITIKREKLENVKSIIAKMPPTWHNQIDYTPIFTVLDKWIKSIQDKKASEDKEDNKIATCILVALVVFVVLDFILIDKYPLPATVANFVLLFLFFLMALDAYADVKNRSHR